MEMAKTTWTYVENYLKNSQTLIIPIGSTEQHGPTALIGTDFITSNHIAIEVGSKLNTLVAPALNYGMANHHLGFAGSASLNPSTYIKVHLELLEGWIKQGFKTFIYINGHGGNIMPLNCAISELKRTDDESVVSIFNWWHLPSVREYEEKHFGKENGHHATCGEVSLTQHIYPEAFEKIENKNFEIKPVSHHWPLSPKEMQKFHPDGRMLSNPGLANKDHGKKLLDLAVKEIAEKIKTFK